MPIPEVLGKRIFFTPISSMQEFDQLLRFGRFRRPFDPGVDVFGVLAEDHHVEFLGMLNRARHAREVAHRPQAYVEVEHLAQRHVERADAAADRRGQRALNPDQELAERLDGFIGQPGVELSRTTFRPRRLPSTRSCACRHRFS